MTGTFRISHVLPGLYDFVISPFGANEGHLRSGIRVTGEKTTLSWALGRTAKVVVEAKTSTPTKALPYAMVASEEHPKLRVLHKIERKDGSAGPVPMQLPTGRYRLFGLSEEPGLSCEASLVDVTEDVNIDFTLVPAGAVKVALRGKPDEIAGRIVRLWDSDGQLVPRLYDPKWSYDYYFVPAVVFPTAYDGITTIRRIRPGRYEVSVDGAQQRRAVTVRAGETTMVSIELKQ
jgi:hypothetical protein